MESGRFSGEEHPHQQADQHFKLPKFSAFSPCWCKSTSNLEDVNWVQNFMAMLKPLIGEEVEKALIRVLQVSNLICPYCKILPCIQVQGTKHEEPCAEDDLCHLVNIGKTVRERARKAGINTVKDFLQLYDTNAQELQQIIGVPEAKWNAIVKNAKACKLPNMANESHRNNVDTLGTMNPEQILNQHQQQQRKTQGHDHIQLQPPLPPPCRSFDVVGHNSDAGTHVSNSNQMGSIPPFNFDVTAADQGSNSMLGALQTEDYEQLWMQESEWEQYIKLLEGSPLCEERSNAPEVTSKLIAACYVTKAASLFMISIQQDSSAPKKKRKLQ